MWIVAAGGSFMLAFLIAVAAGQLGLGRSGGELGVRLDLVLFLALLGLFGSLAAWASARLAFGHWPAVDGSAVATAAVGIILAGAVELALHEWGRARFGHYDPDMVGWTVGLAYAVAVLAAVAFAILVAPPGAAEPPVLGSFGLAMAILSSPSP